jgi:hypothetical protein
MGAVTTALFRGLVRRVVPSAYSIYLMGLQNGLRKVVWDLFLPYEINFAKLQSVVTNLRYGEIRKPSSNPSNGVGERENRSGLNSWIWV